MHLSHFTYLLDVDEEVFLDDRYVLAADGGDESRRLDPDPPFLLPLQEEKEPTMLLACCDRLTNDEEVVTEGALRERGESN
mmetsp:Transcript_12201/g.18436  ORF Transcript_12201/g.18436 Transcript_12201/m.18436 type:complete len:81 (+) Transcript_12201:45-287(+)